MTLTCVVVRFGQQGCHAFESFVAKLSDSSAFCAKQVLVVRYASRRFVALESFTKITFDNQTTAHQHFDSTIHCCGAGIRALRPQLLGNVFGREMPIGAQNSVRNREALRGDGKIVVTQIVAKCTATLRSRVERGECPVGVVVHVDVDVAAMVELEARGEAHALFVRP